MDIEATERQIKDMDVEYEKIKEINSNSLVLVQTEQKLLGGSRPSII